MSQFLKLGMAESIKQKNVNETIINNPRYKNEVGGGRWPEKDSVHFAFIVDKNSRINLISVQLFSFLRI